jgi:threonine/homoserine/homoserine lactone efflux protein
LAGLGTWSGIAVGTYCHALAAAFGLSELFLAVPVAYDIVRYVGAAYLLYLAYKAVTSKDKPDVSAPADQRGGNISAMFMQGLLTNLLNPKMAIFVLALFPQFVSPAHGPIATQILIFATLFNLIGLVINGVVIVMASNISRFLRPQKWMQKAARYRLRTH